VIVGRHTAGDRDLGIVERCNRRRYATRQEARADVFDYIERFYNPTRRHSTLGNVSPVAFERAAAVA
jgi:putative transposase